MQRSNGGIGWLGRALAFVAALGVTMGGMAAPAEAAGVIKQPNAHPDYTFEAEPHLLLGWLDPPGAASGHGYGLGFRGTFELVDPGFIKSINNTVGIGFGLDWVDYRWEDCERGPNRVWVCDDDDQDYLWVPIVMQWNFFLHDQWSVFGEPGGAIRLRGPGKDKIDPLVFYAGGRWHFSDNATLTMRLGYPAFSVGVSFLL